MLTLISLLFFVVYFVHHYGVAGVHPKGLTVNSGGIRIS